MDLSKLFVVYDPSRTEQTALDRAAAIASELGQALHIYACIYSDIPKTEDKATAIAASIDKQKTELEAIAAELGLADGSVSTEVEWDKDWYQAVVRASIRHQATAVLKSSYKHSKRKRILNKSSDWTLIRECLCPVMLVKEGGGGAAQRRVLAAVDARAKAGEYANLNKNIIQLSQRVLAADSTEVHYVSAYQDSMEFPDRGVLMRNCGAENDKIHIKQGTPEKVIVDSAKSLDVGLVVIGSAARTGLAAMLHGNTAEKILDDLDCSVLSVP